MITPSFLSKCVFFVHKSAHNAGTEKQVLSICLLHDSQHSDKKEKVDV